MTDKPLERVKIFHTKFLIDVPSKPTVPAPDICQLRIDLIQEELDELKEAFENNDIVGIADALGDLSVVVDGGYDVCGLSDYKDALSLEIFNSNMSKLGADGKPIYRHDGKVLKGPDYFRPNIARVLELDDGDTAKTEEAA